MTREKLATLLTAGAVVSGLAIVVAKNKGITMASLNPAMIEQALTPKPALPEDSIYAMLDAAKAGDAKAYLASYTGHVRELLEHSATEATPSGFEKYLRESNAAIQGVALSRAESLADSKVRVRVEYVYKDRNDVQFLYLQREGRGWKIYQIDGSEHVKTLVPYGSAVVD